MNCAQIKQDLLALADGELSAPEATRLQEHIQSCADCRAAYEQWQKTLQALAQTPATEPSPSLNQRFFEKLDQENQGSWLPAWLQIFRKPPVLAGAGALVGVVLLLLWLQPANPPADQSEEMIARHLEMFNDYETLRQLELLADLEYIEALSDEV